MSTSSPIDVVLIGGGIMSATLGSMLQRLQPDWTIRIYERLGDVAQESSNPWNNAGTGHSALCELNYTPETDDGIDLSKALNINEQFQVSRQYWASLVEAGELPDPGGFINSTPHMSFVRGAENVEFLRKRYEALKEQPLFAGIEFTDDHEKLAEWAPLLMRKRNPRARLAATRVPAGTDVDFGALTRKLIDNMVERGAELALNYQVKRIRRADDGLWRITAKRLVGSSRHEATARFVFVGAGGGALTLLQGAGIPEIHGFGGFPISGKFLRTRNPRLVEQHHAKVYGKAAVGAPPMSVPHLDTRVVDGEASLMFGPYAGFSPKFLKVGSWFDLPGSVRAGNLPVMIRVALTNLDLLRYLIGELLATRSKRLKALREFVPTVKGDDWEMITAGQRVQIMKRDPERGGILQMGTEVVAAGDGTLAGLLGASPGASTAVPIMLRLIKQCFPDRYDGWEPRLRELVPTLGETLNDQPKKAREVMERTAKTLGLSA